MGNQELQEECDRLRAENETLRQQLEDESHMRLRGQIRELEQKLADKHQQMIETRDKGWKEIKILIEQRDRFQRQCETIGQELREIRESLPDDEARSLNASVPVQDVALIALDAADLLQQLRAKLPKSKTGLKEVEVILQLLQQQQQH